MSESALDFFHLLSSEPPDKTLGFLFPYPRNKKAGTDTNRQEYYDKKDLWRGHKAVEVNCFYLFKILFQQEGCLLHSLGMMVSRGHRKIEFYTSKNKKKLKISSIYG